MIPLTIYMDQRDADITDAIPAGQLAMYFINDIVKIKTGTTIRTLDIGITIEEVQDLLQNTFTDTSSIQWTYDDNANAYYANLNPTLVSLINSGLQPNDNISELTNDSGFETPAQLNARDVANRSRANHTGTQAASTITGLATVATTGDHDDLINKPVFGEGANDTSKNTTETNGTTTLATYLTMQHVGKAGARYRIGVTVAWNINSASRNIVIQLVHNGTPLGVLEMETKDVGADIRNWTSGFFYLDELTDNTYDIEVQFAPENGQDTATIYYAGLEVWRVS